MPVGSGKKGEAGPAGRRLRVGSNVSGTGFGATLRFVSVAIAVGLLAACNTSRNAEKETAADQPAGALYNQGLAYMNDGKLSDAVKSFEEVDRQHPYSEWARKALLMSAFANYRRGRNDEAIQAARTPHTRSI
jgi:outer membrane protein assembly factor BamD